MADNFQRQIVGHLTVDRSPLCILCAVLLLGLWPSLAWSQAEAPAPDPPLPEEDAPVNQPGPMMIQIDVPDLPETATAGGSAGDPEPAPVPADDWPLLKDDAGLLHPDDFDVLQQILRTVRDSEDLHIYIHTIGSAELKEKAEQVVSLLQNELTAKKGLILVFTEESQTMISAQSTMLELQHGKENLSRLNLFALRQSRMALGNSERVQTYARTVLETLAPEHLPQGETAAEQETGDDGAQPRPARNAVSPEGFLTTDDLLTLMQADPAPESAPGEQSAQEQGASLSRAVTRELDDLEREIAVATEEVSDSGETAKTTPPDEDSAAGDPPVFLLTMLGILAVTVIILLLILFRVSRKRKRKSSGPEWQAQSSIARRKPAQGTSKPPEKAAASAPEKTAPRARDARPPKTEEKVEPPVSATESPRQKITAEESAQSPVTSREEPERAPRKPVTGRELPIVPKKKEPDTMKTPAAEPGQPDASGGRDSGALKKPMPIPSQPRTRRREGAPPEKPIEETPRPELAVKKELEQLSRQARQNGPRRRLNAEDLDRIRKRYEALLKVAPATMKPAIVESLAAFVHEMGANRARNRALGASRDPVTKRRRDPARPSGEDSGELNRSRRERGKSRHEDSY